MDLPGPCLVEVKYFLHPDGIKAVESLISKFQTDVRSVLIVAQDFKEARPRIVERLQAKFPQIQIKILNKSDIDAIDSNFSIGPLKSFTEYTVLIDSARKKDIPVDVHSANADKQHITALRSAYNDDKLALFIGAGVSRSAGLPDWPQLVQTVTTQVLDKKSNSILSEQDRQEIQIFFEKEVPASPLIVARLLQNALEDDFADSVRDALYRKATSTSSSLLLQEIGALCMPPRGRLGIVGVVNYNFDDLLEKELERRNVDFYTVMSEGAKISRSSLPIYHVHGYLPRTVVLDDTHKDALVLSENAYHNQFTDPFIWTNITQLNLLRNNVCLFIGISFTDPNHRRLLEITANKFPGVSHYAILVDHWQGPAAKKLSDSGQALALSFRKLEESSFRELGLSIIWVKDFDAVPMMINEIKRSSI